jgi:hypothetical protein
MDRVGVEPMTAAHQQQASSISIIVASTFETKRKGKAAKEVLHI